MTTESTRTTVYKESPLTSCRIPPSRTPSKPLEVTAFPSAIPPIARKTTVHKNCSKSSCRFFSTFIKSHPIRQTFLSTPVEKNATIGMSAITPISPTYSSIECSAHHKAIVTKQTNTTQYCCFVNLSFSGRISLITNTSPSGAVLGLYETMSKSQIRKFEIIPTGSETANHCNQSNLGSIFWMAMRFWGEDMGEACPPMLAAKAIAI